MSSLSTYRLAGALALTAVAGAIGAEQAAAPRPVLQVHGPVSSPVFDELSRLSDVRRGAGAGAVLVVDGDALTPQALARDPQVRAALDAGRWVLALDVTPEHKRDGLGALLGAGTSTPSSAYLVRLAAAERGAPRDTWIVDPGREEQEHERLLLQRSGRALAAPGASEASTPAAVARRVADYVTGRVVLPERSQGGSIPPGLLYKNYFFSHSQSLPLPKPAVTDGQQTANLTTLATYQVFLDNSGHPQGNFQYVAFSLDGLANPTDGARQLAADWWGEHAWLQSLLAISVEPESGSPVDFVASAPANRNGETTYVNDATFKVGFNLPGGLNGDYTWGTTTSYTITDWVALARSSGIDGNWDFASAHPGNGLASDLTGCDAGWMRTCFMQSGLPNSFNTLNASTLAFHAEEVWKTRGVLDQSLVVNFKAAQQLLDAYCQHYSPGACWGGETVLAVNNGWWDTHWIDLGAVLPVPISALTYDPPQATAGQPVTATLTLAAPAPTDVTVMLASNSQNATVLPSVLVKQGESSAQFQILTNDNGLGHHGSTVATLTAFYASNFQSQLRITKP